MHWQGKTILAMNIISYPTYGRFRRFGFLRLSVFSLILLLAQVTPSYGFRFGSSPMEPARSIDSSWGLVYESPFTQATPPSPFGSGREVELESIRILEQLDRLSSHNPDFEELRNLYLEGVTEQLKHYKWQLSERQFVYTYTNKISIFICVFVHLGVFLGIWAASAEFLQAHKMRNRSRESTELEISAARVALKTSLHGLLLLSISLALYFTYLIIVYPITS